MEENGVVADPLSEVRTAWKEKRVTAAEIARRTGRTLATVARALKGEIDPPYSVALAYHEAWRTIQAEEVVGKESA